MSMFMHNCLDSGYSSCYVNFYPIPTFILYNQVDQSRSTFAREKFNTTHDSKIFQRMYINTTFYMCSQYLYKEKRKYKFIPVTPS